MSSQTAGNITRFTSLLGVLCLCACDALGVAPGGAPSRPVPSSVEERDIEAPEVFQTVEAALWDGRPSTGGIWASHPDATDPLRVIMRNRENGFFAIGALFPQGAAGDGPQLQLSAEAAAALDVIAGQPTFLDVVALRRERVTLDAPQPQIGQPIATVPLAGAGDDGVQTTTLGLPAPSDAPPSPLNAAATASPSSQGAIMPPVASAPPAASPSAVVAPAPAQPTSPASVASPLAKPYIQIGIFGVEENADGAATNMRRAGLTPQIRQIRLNDKTFWSVRVGPAQTVAQRDAFLQRIKAQGFGDAFAVSGQG